MCLAALILGGVPATSIDSAIEVRDLILARPGSLVMQQWVANSNGPEAFYKAATTDRAELMVTKDADPFRCSRVAGGRAEKVRIHGQPGCMVVWSGDQGGDIELSWRHGNLSISWVFRGPILSALAKAKKEITNVSAAADAWISVVLEPNAGARSEVVANRKLLDGFFASREVGQLGDTPGVDEFLH